MGLIDWPDWTAGSVAGYAALALFNLAAGPLEHFGLTTIRYSRFRRGTGISSRTGMLLLYGIPLLVHIGWSLGFLDDANLTQLVLFLAVTGHFAKRCLEVIFVHRYSGPIDVGSVIQIGLSYTFTAWLAAWLNEDAGPPVDGVFWAGLMLYLAGQAGNFYHHLLLARLRRDSDAYFVPRGGAFRWVSSPHYFFELCAWFGIALLSRELGLWLIAVGMLGYLTVRARKTHDWYWEHFRDYPAERRALVPGVL